MPYLLLIVFALSLSETAFGADADYSSAGASLTQSRKIGYYADKNDSFFYKSYVRSYLATDSIPPAVLYYRGMQDAKIFYKNKAAFWIPFAATMGSVFIPYTFFVPGLATGLAAGFTKPKERNLWKHDIRYRSPGMIEHTEQLFQDSLYMAGYRKGAQKRKLGNAAGGFGAGVGVSGLIGLMFIMYVLVIFQ